MAASAISRMENSSEMIVKSRPDCSPDHNSITACFHIADRNIIGNVASSGAVEGCTRRHDDDKTAAIFLNFRGVGWCRICICRRIAYHSKVESPKRSGPLTPLHSNPTVLNLKVVVICCYTTHTINSIYLSILS